MSQNIDKTLAAVAKQQAKAKKKALKDAKKQAKKQQKAEKHAILTVHKRPIVCPPDKAGKSLLFRLMGYICRVLVIWLASAGLVTFVSAALDLGVAYSTIFLCTFAVVALVAIALYARWGAIVSSVIAAGSVVVLFLTRPSIIMDLVYGVLSIYNAALKRLYNIGYLAYVRYQVSFTSSTPTEELLTVGVCLLCVIVGLVFAFSLIKRVRIIPPAILATTFLVVILTFNIYSNRIKSNLGIVLVIVSFATVLVMAAYDRLYRVKNEKRYDTEMNLFGDSDRPAYPAGYMTKAEKKAARKADKKMPSEAAKAVAATQQAPETENQAKPPKGKGKQKPSPAEIKQKKEEKRAFRRQVNAVKKYDRVTEQSRIAMSGFASAAAMLLALLIIAIPAFTVKGNFETISAIDEKMAYARDYVTALLRGDDARLDELEYGADKNNFKPHSTDLEQLNFTGKQIFYVESRYNTNYYLRGWIGTGYRDGAWLAVDDATLEQYRAMFPTSRSPGEEFRYQFYHYMMPSLVDDPNYNEDYLNKYQSNLPYGFVNALVSLRRVNSPSTLTYFPSTFKSIEGMFDYGTTTLSETTYVNYFDGIYTGRDFEDNDTAQATVTYAQVMTSENWSRNQAELIALYNLQREVLLADRYISTNGAGEVVSKVSLSQTDKGATKEFTYWYNRGRRDERSWSFTHEAGNVIRSGNIIMVQSPQGRLQITLGEDDVIQSIKLLNTSDSRESSGFLNDYKTSMSSAERSALLTYLEEYSAYTDFVYNTYLDTSNSSAIKNLAWEIADQAHIEVQKKETVPDDPTIEGDDSYTRVYWENEPVDVDLANLKNAGTAEAYVQRDLLVRNVIDYIIYEQGCEYTITPDLTNVDEALDGVENFLFNTKQGYCVQFASSAALILRQLGIPTRYVEGYIASNLTRKSFGSDMSYGGYVKDYEAHAWIEVYFDGVGWVQYETTPEYYSGMYGVKSNDSVIPSEPKPPVETQKPDDPKDPVGPEETDTEEETTEGDTLDIEDNSGVMRATLIGLAIMVGIALVAAIIGSIISGARRAEERRQSVVSQVLDDGFGNQVNDRDRQEMAFSMSDSVSVLLKLYDLAPKPGEFREEYADRLTAALNRPDKRKKKTETEAGVTLPDMHLVLNAMAAEEFGYGMTVQEMKMMATFYLYLRRELKYRLPLMTRFYLRFIKRLI